MEGHERLLTVPEIAALFHVNPKTVRRWINAGKLAAGRTPGGHYRSRESEVRMLLAVMNARPGIVPSPPQGAGPGPEHG